ncbi:MAG TPA: polysaccharide biosynthesis/export family protein [Pyrinomonadaceae bacterium]|nr:polysaccharide biosynthesis/export family protein [Pyrinomonadaceae bacterium]
MKTTFKLLSIAVLCLSVASLVVAQQPVDTGGSSSPIGGGGANDGALSNALDEAGIKKYQLGPGDVLDLRVFGEPNFTGQLVVNDEGFVEVPFLKPIEAKCRTDIEVKRDIIKALSEYLQNPQVSLRITERHSRPPAVVFGAVRQATRAHMNRRVRLLELLAVAGGTTDAAGGDIQVYHTEPVMCPTEEDLAMLASQKTTEDSFQVPFNIYSLIDLKKGEQKANPVIRPGDIVIVSDAPPIFVTGTGVYSPNNLYLRNEMSLMRAIAQVGGVRKEAKTDKVRIYRTKPGQLEPDILTVNFDDIRKKKAPDIALQPYDIIEIGTGSPWGPKQLPTTLLGFATGTASTVMQSGAVRIIN